MNYLDFSSGKRIGITPYGGQDWLNFHQGLLMLRHAWSTNTKMALFKKIIRSVLLLVAIAIPSTQHISKVALLELLFKHSLVLKRNRWFKYIKSTLKEKLGLFTIFFIADEITLKQGETEKLFRNELGIISTLNIIQLQEIFDKYFQKHYLKLRKKIKSRKRKPQNKNNSRLSTAFRKRLIKFYYLD